MSLGKIKYTRQHLGAGCCLNVFLEHSNISFFNNYFTCRVPEAKASFHKKSGSIDFKNKEQEQRNKRLVARWSSVTTGPRR